MLKLKASQLTTKTRRLIIRPYKSSDYKAWSQGVLGRRPKQNQFENGKPAPEKVKRAVFMKWMRMSARAEKKDLVYLFGIFDRVTGENFGFLNLAVISRLTYQFANLGYEINNQYWGKGYAPEAIRAALPIIFTRLKLHRLEAGIQMRNKASIRTAEKAGMKRESIRKKYYFDGKRWLDLVYYVAIAESFGVQNTKPVIKVRMTDYM